MKKESALFDLVKSLTKGEKRFIKIYLSRYLDADKNNSLRLFDAIEKLKKYDEEKLKKKIYGNSFSGNFRGVKSHLYFLILNCLEFHHNDYSVDRRASKYINIARLLSRKRLDQQSDKIIERTRKLSDEFNRFENITVLNSLKIATEFKKEDVAIDKIELYYKENFSAIENIKLKLEYNKVYHELLYKRLEIGSITSQTEKRAFENFYKNGYLNKPPLNSFFDASMFYLLAKIEYCRIVEDIKGGAVYIRKLIELFEKNTHRIEDNVDHYIKALNIFIAEQAYANNRSEADAGLKKMLSIPSLISDKDVSYDVSVQIFQMYYVVLTHAILIFRDYEGGVFHIRKFEAEKKKFEKYFPPGFLLCMQANIAFIYFGLGQYKIALKWCNEALAHPPKTRADIRYGVRILYLLIHYELGNQLILHSLIRSSYRYFQKMKKGNQFLIILLKYLRLLLRAESKEEKKLMFTEFKEKTLPLLADPFEKTIFYHIDVIGWIDKKIRELNVTSEV